MNCPSCRTLIYVTEQKCPACGWYPAKPSPAGVKPFGWEITYEYRNKLGAIARGQLHRAGPLSKARMAARLKSCFMSIVEERHVATKADYMRAFGDCATRM